MAKEKKHLFSITMDDETFRRTENYRATQRKENGSLPSRSEVVVELVQKGLDIMHEKE